MKYEFECNMSKADYEDKHETDEWGCAFIWDENEHGCEYNYCYDSGECCCAIYKIDCSGRYLETDHSIFEHYEIDFSDDNWEDKLKDSMIRCCQQWWGTEIAMLDICVYLDTITLQEENDDDNLAYIEVPRVLVKRWFVENKIADEDSFDHWLNEYTADETESLFNWIICETDYNPLVK